MMTTELSNLPGDVNVADEADVAAYLEQYPHIAAAVPYICAETRKEFGGAAELCLEVRRDPHTQDSHLRLIVRLPKYDENFARRINRLLDLVFERVPESSPGIFVVNSDFLTPGDVDPDANTMSAAQLTRLPGNVVVPDPADVAAYLRMYRGLTLVLPELCAATRKEFGDDTELLLEVRRDPEIDDPHLTLVARLSDYNSMVASRINRLRESQIYDKLPETTEGWLLLTAF